MPTIPFPDVPKVPGVPAIPRSPLFPPAAQAALGLVQGALWRSFQSGTRWGIFDSQGKALADPSKLTGAAGTLAGSLGVGATLSTDSVDFSKETRVSDFPVERGSFAAYNKVELPATPTVTLCLAGTEAERTQFLAAIDAACKSVDLYDVVTPEVTYKGYSIERYAYQRRTSRGATLIAVELGLKEILQVSAQYTQTQRPTQEPSAAATTDNGKVQAQTPKQSALKSLASKIPTLGDIIKGVTR